MEALLSEATIEFRGLLDERTSMDLVVAALDRFTGTFTLKDIEKACLGASPDMVRKVLRDLKKEGSVQCLGRGPGAAWRKKGSTLKRG